MSARLPSLPARSSPASAVNAIVDFSKKGFGDTQMFGLLAQQWPHLRTR